VPSECTYFYYGDDITISPENELEVITIYDTISISFELQLDTNWICDEEWCNVLNLGFLNLAIRPGDFQMGISTNSGTVQYVVGSLDDSNDGANHLYEIKISPYDRVISYDGTTLLSVSGEFPMTDYVDDDGENYSLLLNGDNLGTVLNLCIDTYSGTESSTVEPTVISTAEESLAEISIEADGADGAGGALIVMLSLCCMVLFVCFCGSWLISSQQFNAKEGNPIWAFMAGCCGLALFIGGIIVAVHIHWLRIGQVTISTTATVVVISLCCIVLLCCCIILFLWKRTTFCSRADMLCIVLCDKTTVCCGLRRNDEKDLERTISMEQEADIDLEGNVDPSVPVFAPSMMLETALDLEAGGQQRTISRYSETASTILKQETPENESVEPIDDDGGNINPDLPVHAPDESPEPIYDEEMPLEQLSKPDDKQLELQDEESGFKHKRQDTVSDEDQIIRSEEPDDERSGTKCQSEASSTQIPAQHYED